MKMTPCENGHYYDKSNHGSCPYCADSNSTLQDIEPIDKTMIYQKKEATPKERTVQTAMVLDSNNNEKQEHKPTETMLTAGWLVITSPKGRGKNYTLTYGMNTLGRSSSNHVCIDNDDHAISREKHATIIYDFENREFYIQHNDGKYLTYLNGELVSGLTPLKERNNIKIGHTEFIFIPLCGESFSWDEDEQQDDED